MDEAGRLKGASRAYVVTAVEESLKRLKTEWIDLYYLHRPDPATPIEETLRALEDLVRQGQGELSPRRHPCGAKRRGWRRVLGKQSTRQSCAVREPLTVQPSTHRTSR
jgi:hypothetical protein